MTLDPTKRFKIYQQLGEGSFSKIYHALDKKTKMDVAIKVEKEDKHKKILKFEYEILKSLQGLNHVPLLFDFIENTQNKILTSIDGKEVPQVLHASQKSVQSQSGIIGLNFIVMELLGKNVANYKKSSSSYSLLTAYEILLQMLDSIEDLHGKGYIHRDIKPANFVIKENKNNSNAAYNLDDQTDNKNNLKIYMVDFGLAKIHLDKNLRPLPPKLNTDFRGTLTYASLNAHYKKELSRRDDLWSFFFVILDLLNENLPWRTCKDDKDDIKKVKESCLAEPEKKLFLTSCKGSMEILEILNHLKTLNYCDKPNYNLIRKKLGDLKTKEFYKLNGFPHSLQQNINWGEMANYFGQNLNGDADFMAYLNKDNLFQNMCNSGRVPQADSYNFNIYNQNLHQNLSKNSQFNIDIMNNSLGNIPYLSNFLNFNNGRENTPSSNIYKGNNQNPSTNPNPNQYDILEGHFKTNFQYPNPQTQNFENLKTMPMPYLKNNNNLNLNMNYLPNMNNYCQDKQNTGNNLFYNMSQGGNVNNMAHTTYLDGFLNNFNFKNLNNNLNTAAPINNYNLIDPNSGYLHQIYNSNNIPLNLNVPRQEVINNQYEGNLNKKRKRDDQEEFNISNNNNNSAKNQIFIFNQFNKNNLSELETKLLDILIKNTGLNSQQVMNENLCDLKTENKVITNENFQEEKLNDKNCSSQINQNNHINQITKPRSKNEYDINNCDRNLINSITKKLTPVSKKSELNRGAANAAITNPLNSKQEEKIQISNEEKNSNLINQLNLFLDQNKPITWENFLNNNLMKDIMNKDVNSIMNNCIFNQNFNPSDLNTHKQNNISQNDLEKIYVKNSQSNIINNSGCDRKQKRLIFKIEKIKKR